MFKYNENTKLKVGWYPLSNDEQKSMGKKRVSLILVVLLLLLAACGPTATGTEENDTPAAVQEAQAWLAEQLNVSVEDVTVVSTEQVEWTDSCLGLGGAAEICAAVITPGWQANFEVDGQEYEVRLDETGASVRSPQLPYP
jgi:ABC-type glycerol-3-phosphate transport system substrate-binding protein